MASARQDPGKNGVLIPKSVAVFISLQGPQPPQSQQDAWRSACIRGGNDTFRVLLARCSESGDLIRYTGPHATLTRRAGEVLSVYEKATLPPLRVLTVHPQILFQVQKKFPRGIALVMMEIENQGWFQGIMRKGQFQS
jgi:hypothetical protein